MGTDENNIESSEDRDPMDDTKSNDISGSFGLEAREISGIEGTISPDFKSKNFRQPENQPETRGQDLGEKSQAVGPPPKKKKGFLLKTLMFILIFALGSAVYFLVKERQKNLQQIQEQLARLEIQIRILQTEQKEPDLSLQNQQALDTRLQKLESIVKQLAKPTRELPTPSKEGLADEKRPEDSEALELKGEIEQNAENTSQATTDGPTDETEFAANQPTVDDSLEIQAESKAEKLQTASIEKETVRSEVELKNTSAEEKSIPEKGVDESQAGGVIEKKLMPLAIEEKTLKPQVEEMVRSKVVGVAEKSSEGEGKKDVKQNSPVEDLIKETEKTETTSHEKSTRIVKVPKPKPQTTSIPPSPTQKHDAPSTETDVSQILSPGAKLYVEFVESIAERAFQIIQKGFAASFYFLRKVA